MAFDKTLAEDILKQVDIVKIISAYQPVHKKGKDHVGICPFHDDSNPSMHISSSKRIFKCFSCGAGGDAINYVKRRENISYFEALKKVAEISNISDPRLDKQVSNKPIDEKKEALLKCLKDLTNYYNYALSTDEGKIGLDYLLSRQLDESMQQKYRLGYAFNDGKATIGFLQNKGHQLKTIEDTGIAHVINGQYSDKNAGRVIFPIADIEGNVIGYSARTLKPKDDAKYVNTPETYLFHKSNVLYNYHIAKSCAHLEGYVYVLEGFMDVFALARIGINSAVALMGTALTLEHINLLRRLGVQVRLCLDGDKPGQDATLKASKLLAANGIDFMIVDNRNSSEDPDEIYISKGEVGLRAYLNNLISRVDFALNYFTNTNPLKDSKQKQDLIMQFIPILLNVNNTLEFDSYLRKLANITGYDVEAIRKAVLQARSNPTMQKEQIVKSFIPEDKLLRRLLLAEKEMLYQMLNHKEAVTYYETYISGFYDETYRMIAYYIIEYAKDHDQIDVSSIISTLENMDDQNNEELIKTITEIQFEDNHPQECTKALLDGLVDNMNKERNHIFEEDRINESFKGKSPQERARILAEYIKRKHTLK